MKYFLTFLLIFTLTSCNEKIDKAENDKKYAEENHQEDESSDHEHSHEAPNGGVLTEVGEHAASLEWLVEDGQFKIYIFDGCAEKPIRVAQKEIKVVLKVDEEKEISLTPVTNKLTGEKPGDSNTFAADVSDLSKEKISAITVHSVAIQGIDYKNVNLKVK